MDIGDTFVCQETGKTLIVQRCGCSYNYAYTPDGDPISDEGVDIRERRHMLAHDKPITLYLSADSQTVTGWKGNVLGTVYDLKRSSHPWLSRLDRFYSFRVKDVHGNHWYGRGSSGTATTIRPCKPK